jgi:outer membrane protein OmpA-like peptidoglycan-associated protein
MSINLLEMLKTSIAPEIAKQASGYLGESEGSVKAAVDSIFPTLIGGLMQTGKSPEGATKLLNMINTGPSIDASMLGNLAGLFSGGERTGTLLGIGGTLLRSLFSDKADGINAALSGMNNMKAGSGGSLMAMITPLLFGMLKNHITTQKLDSAGLMKLLSSQGPYIAPALSDKTTYAMGLGSVAAFLGGTSGVGAVSAKKSDVIAPVRATSGVAPMTANAPAANDVALNAMNAMNTARDINYGEEASGGWWKKLLPLVALAVAGYFAFNFFMKGKDSVDKSAADKAPPTVTAAQAELPKSVAEPAKEVVKAATEIVKEVPVPAAVPAAASGMKSYSTPGGGKIEVALNGISNKLLAAITTPNAALNKPFNLDKLLFNSDSADLGAEGRQQLQEVAGVLKAFPSVQIKLNGHADNSGAPASNKTLSSSRAAVVKEELSKLGVAADRISTDSFSASQPIASNATEGGRQQNRRVEIAITKR